MSDSLSSDWLSTDEDSFDSGKAVNIFIEEEGAGDTGIGTRDTGQNLYSSRIPCSESRIPISLERNYKKHIHFIGIGMGAVGIAALMFIFIQGVSFLQANIVQDSEINNLPLPTLIEDTGHGTRDSGM